MNTLRDAEVVIQRLARQIEVLRKQIVYLSETKMDKLAEPENKGVGHEVLPDAKSARIFKSTQPRMK